MSITLTTCPRALRQDFAKIIKAYDAAHRKIKTIKTNILKINKEIASQTINISKIKENVQFNKTTPWSVKVPYLLTIQNLMNQIRVITI